ncbi:MAG: hypothetical protein SPL13_02535, partial [Clostridia bacterium]|nr:hypothetical protein [Clostridia bacterium]
MKKTIKLYLTAFLTALLLAMATLFGLTAFKVQANAEEGTATTTYSCSSTAFQRLVAVEGTAPNRKITVEVAIYCLLP